jgi:hypothetical protein
MDDSRMGIAGTGAMLISVHIPKTGGTTFRDILVHQFGDRLYLDYQDRPLAHNRLRRNLHALLARRKAAGVASKYACVHGHFLPLKYSLVAGASFAIWLRDPAERVVSRYYHWIRQLERGETLHGRHARVLPDRPVGLDEFVELPHYHEVYHQYLWNFGIERFDFVGITERYDDSLRAFVAMYGLSDVQCRDHLNINPGKESACYDIPAALRARIAQRNRRDHVIYEQALAMNRRLCAVQSGIRQ